MRSPLGPVLIILGLATTLVLVLVLLQASAIRDDLRGLGDRLDALEDDVATIETGVDRQELERQLGILESGLRDWLIATGADGFDPDAEQGSGQARNEVLERLDEILDRIDALDARLDEICEGVPVC